MTLIAQILKYAETPKWPSLAVFLLCVFSLCFALISQYVFGLRPCILCIYQRWPFVIAGLIGLYAFSISDNRAELAAILLAVCGVVFFVNFGIAVMHVGVEEGWWRGTEGCSLPDLSNAATPEAFLAMIESAPVTPCSQPQFRLYGVTMAGMNVLLSLVMTGFSLFCSVFAVRKRNGF